MQDLAGRVAVVTGAASGIGRALACRFGARGMRVVVADVERTPLDETAELVRAGGGDVLVVPTDVSDAAAVDALADATAARFGKVHVVCNNAGVFAGGTTWEASLAEYAWVLGVNVWGVIHGIRTFVPRLLAQREPGHVVNTASMAALTSGPYAGPYAMTKQAVLALSEARPCAHCRQTLAESIAVENLELIDREGMASYLESTNPANIARYESVGFRQVGSFTLPADGPTVDTMWREARTT